MDSEAKITPQNQHQPNDYRKEFLRGVDDEAIHQGYSIYSRGRLFVAALRHWEKR